MESKEIPSDKAESSCCEWVWRTNGPASLQHTVAGALDGEAF